MNDKNARGGCCGGASPDAARPSNYLPETEVEIRAQVSEAYARAVELSRQGGGSCCGNAAPLGVASQTAGYTPDEMTEFQSASQSSFGCGNPLAFAALKEGQTVVDLGSGAGFDLLIASKKVGEKGHVIGVDMTDAMLEVARENLLRAKANNVELRKGTIEELPLDDASVDWVISNCVINLSPEKNKVFREIARVLRPGGRFSVSDIVAENLPADLLAQAAAYSACIGGAISETEYLAGLEAAGLRDLTVSERNVYDEAQLRGMVGNDLEALGVPRELLDSQLKHAAGKVWSAKISGRKP